ncbi:histonelysine Nmethyltransferase SETMARlike [Trichonephila clavipes]|nr:histonelysine Nmethyltransferase SETMARlike [Trichonephila clavipes]
MKKNGYQKVNKPVCHQMSPKAVEKRRKRSWPLYLKLPKGIFDVNDAPRTGRPVFENIDKIPEIIEVDRHVSSRSIAQELKIDIEIVLSHLRKVGFKKKLHIWVSHQSTPKNMTDRISLCETLARRNEINQFLKRVTSTWPNTKFRSLLSTTGPFEASERPEMAKIGQQKRYCVPSGQHQATYFCSDSPDPLGAWLGNFNASTI